MPNITSVTVLFANAIKREEYGPVKKAEVSITASVADNEDGDAVLDQVSKLAIAKVAAMLDAPKPATASAPAPVTVASEPQEAGEAPARRTRGPNKSKVEPAEATATEVVAAEPSASDAGPAAETEDEWVAGAADIEVTDAELLSATSKRAGELGARDPIVKLIATFATRTEGAPFKVQEIPANQRKDYLTKLAALTA